MKVKPEQRSETRVGQLPFVHASAFPDVSVLEAHKIMLEGKLDVVRVVERENPRKVVGVLKSEGIAQAYQRAKAHR
jgi:hypothetical protein